MLILPIAKVLKRAATVDRTELLDYLQQQQRRAKHAAQSAEKWGARDLAEYSWGKNDAYLELIQHLAETEQN